jgi:uncharacterized membrane protein YoaK (UPF0700 family)
VDVVPASVTERVTGRDVDADPLAAQKHRAAEVIRNRLLVGLSFSAGVVDMIFFLAFGKVFTAFQTGNLVFLGLGAVGSGPQGVVLPDVWRVVVSFLAFAVGVMVSARIVRPAEAEVNVWPQRVSVALAITAVAEAGFLIGWIATFGHPTTAVGYIFLGIMGFAMGVQIDAIRSLGVAEVSTTAATATLVRFANDIAHRSLGTKDRFLRLRIMLAMAVGAAAGTLVLVYARLYAPVLPLLITVVVLVISTTALKPKNSRSGSFPAGISTSG